MIARGYKVVGILSLYRYQSDCSICYKYDLKLINIGKNDIFHVSDVGQRVTFILYVIIVFIRQTHAYIIIR